MSSIAIIKEELIFSMQAIDKQDSLQNNVVTDILTASSSRNRYYQEHLSAAFSGNSRFTKES